MSGEVTTKEYEWADLVRRTEGEQFAEKPVIYEFSNGRKFKEQPDEE